MGWAYVPTDKNVKDFLTEELFPRPIIKSSIRSGVAYLAIQCTDRVLGLVVLLDRRPGQIGYKLISEDMGPYYYGAPANVLNVLTDPAPNEWAGKWRDKCRQAADLILADAGYENYDSLKGWGRGTFVYADGLSRSD